MTTDMFLTLISYIISLYGIAKLNLPEGSSLKDSFETVHRSRQDFSTFKTFNFNQIATEIENGSHSKYRAMDILIQKMNRLDSDFYNVIILFLPFLLSLFMSFQTGSVFFIVLTLIHLALSADTYRIFGEFSKLKEDGFDSVKSAELALGEEKSGYIKAKKIDMFLETWIISAFFMILFVSGLNFCGKIMLFN